MSITQEVLLATDRHDASNEPDEIWIRRHAAFALILWQELDDHHGKTSEERDLMKKLQDFCWDRLKFSKWDFRTIWYIKEVRPPEIVNIEGCTIEGCGCFYENMRKCEDESSQDDEAHALLKKLVASLHKEVQS